MIRNLFSFSSDEKYIYFKFLIFKFRKRLKNRIIAIDENGREQRVSFFYSIPGLKLEIQGKNNLIKIYQPLGFDKKNPSRIHISTDNNEIVIGKSIGVINVDVYCVGGDHQRLIIGNNFSAGGVAFNLLETNSSIEIGDDCMMSADVYIINSDAHCIFDKVSQKLINQAKGIKIGNHVWIGRHCFITKNARIPDGSVCGIGSVISNDYTKAKETDCVIAGNPARIIKNNIKWSRYATWAAIENNI